MLGQDHYLYRLRAACLLQPELNRHQLAALDRELLLIRSCSTPEEHLAKSNNLLGIARATERDRAANALAVALRHDDPWAAAAARLVYHHAGQGADHAEFYAHLYRGHDRASRHLATAAGIRTSAQRLFLNLLHVHTSNYDTAPAHAAIASSFQFLQANDPDWQPALWRSQPRYARCLPWPSPLLDEWLAPLWPPQAPAAPPHPDGHLVVVAPGEWGALDWPVALPLESPIDTANADAYLNRQSVWPDAFLAQHWRTTRQLLLEARTPIAQQAILAGREALFAEEAARHVLEWNALLAPLRAAANHGWERSEASRDGLAKATRVTRALTGLAPLAILDLPEVRHFLAHNLEPLLERGMDGFGALAGEVGFDLAIHAAACRNVAGRLDFRTLLFP